MSKDTTGSIREYHEDLVDRLIRLVKNTHELKILPHWFELVRVGQKRFEVRLNDRGFKPLNGLLLREWDQGEYTGRCVHCWIASVYVSLEDDPLGCPGLMPGYVIMQLGRARYWDYDEWLRHLEPPKWRKANETN